MSLLPNALGRGRGARAFLVLRALSAFWFYWRFAEIIACGCFVGLLVGGGRGVALGLGARRFGVYSAGGFRLRFGGVVICCCLVGLRGVGVGLSRSVDCLNQ